MIPASPAGATIDSLLLAMSRLSASTSLSGAMRKYYGSRHPHANPLARHAAKLSVNAFEGLLSAEQLVLRHSAWPIYSCLVSRPSAQAWFQRTRDGASPVSVPELFCPVKLELSASRWRSCPRCVELHLQEYGTGHWMVIHQLPGIRTCPTHCELLDVACGACGAPLGGAGIDRLPGEPCTRCGTRINDRTRFDGSAGEQQLARLYAKLLDGRAMELDSVNREMLLRCATEVLSRRQRSESLERLVLDSFNCQDAGDLGRLLNVAVSSNRLQFAVKGAATN